MADTESFAEPRRVAVLGPGGVGGLVGALLARAGADVTVLAGAATTSAIRASGLSIRSKRFGDFGVRVRASTQLAEPVDVCFVTVKAPQLTSALDRMTADVLGDALVVPFLNGLDHLAELRTRYPEASVQAAAIRVEAIRVQPGLVFHKSPFASVELAATHISADHRVESIAQFLKRAGLDVTVGGDDREVLWKKLVFLAPLALLTTHAQASIGVVRSERRGDLIALVREVAAVARTDNVATDESDTLAMLDALPAEMQSSMQRDAAAGCDTELDAIGGGVIRCAARYQQSVPVTTRIVEDLQARQASSEA